jgi:hypothetical protein
MPGTKKKGTSVRGSGGYVHDPRYRVTRILHVDQDVQVAGEQDQAYQVYQWKGKFSDTSFPSKHSHSPICSHEHLNITSWIEPIKLID